MSAAERWLGKVNRLHVDTVTKAPHKPLLLLVFLELAELAFCRLKRV
jgi:hypothetical protein